MLGSDKQFPVELLGRYSSPSLLGAGGMGLVFAAEDTVLKRKVAIKVLPRAQQNDKKLVRFQKEARAAGKLSHPNIVNVLNFGVTEAGEPYLVMDYIQGNTLKESIEDGGFSISQAIDVVIEVCRGLDHAHEKGVLHRDIKASNIMVASNANSNSNSHSNSNAKSNSNTNPITCSNAKSNEIKIIDFGLADLRVDQGPGFESTGSIAGSPAYMSPEIGRGEKANVRSEIYSLGCLLFECLTGRLPYEADSIMALMKLHADAPLPALSKYMEEPDSAILKEALIELQEIIEKCLAKDASTRYATFQEFMSDLTRVKSETLLMPIPEEKVYSSESPAREFLRSNFGTTCLLLMLIGGILIPIHVQQTIDKDDVKATRRLIKNPIQEMSILPRDINGKDLDATMLDGDASITDQMVIDGKVEGADQGKYRLGNSKITGKTLDYLKNKEVTDLVLSYTELSTEDLKKLKYIKGVRQINLAGLKESFTDEILDYIDSSNLSLLTLDYTNVTDNGLAKLAKYPSLRIVRLSSCPNITDEGILMLLKCPGLHSISTSSTHISSAGISHFKNLESLRANYCKFSDEDVPNLLKLKNIETFHLKGNLFTREGFEKLSTLPKLKKVDFAFCPNFKMEEERIFNKKGIKVE